MELLDGAVACLDQYSKAYVLLPVGTVGVSNTTTGIAYFRSMMTHYARQYPQVVVIPNTNMMRNDRAIPYMIDRGDPPHHSDRGRQQMITNLLAAIRQHQPAIYAYIDVVHEHVMRLHFDRDHPPPRARFYRCSPDHTGIPDPDYKPPPPVEQSPNAPFSVGQVVSDKGMDQAFASYASVTAAVTRLTASPATPMPTSQDRDTDVQGSVVQSTVSSPSTTLHQTVSSPSTTLHQTRDVRVRSTSQSTAPKPQPTERGIPQGAQASPRDAPSMGADDAQFKYTDIRYRQARGPPTSPQRTVSVAQAPEAMGLPPVLQPGATRPSTSQASKGGGHPHHAPQQAPPPPQLSLEHIQQILQTPELLRQIQLAATAQPPSASDRQ